MKEEELWKPKMVATKENTRNDRGKMVDIVEEAGLSDNECVEIWNIGTEKRAVLLMMGTWIQCLEGCYMKNDDSEYDMPL